VAIGKIREIILAATVFVCPSTHDPLGMVDLVAISGASTVVASDIDGIPEAVADSVTASLAHYDTTIPPVTRTGSPRR
jgi:alpha-maltose-1-phosphate synthase